MKWKLGLFWLSFTKNCIVNNSFFFNYIPMRFLNSHNKDIYKYGSKARKLYKSDKNYTNLVEDHHCIPKQWKHHELLEKLEFDIHGSNNLCIMPNNNGKYHLNLHPDTIVHQGGHAKYNLFVKYHLDEINKLPHEDSTYEFWLFLHYLKKNMKKNDDNIPWK